MMSADRILYSAKVKHPDQIRIALGDSGTDVGVDTFNNTIVWGHNVR